MTFHFVDSRGIDWMVIPGLPADHPAADDSAGAFVPIGFTFRARTGELRVLPRGEIRRPGALTLDLTSWRVGSRLHQVPSAYWEALLDQARPWP